MNNTLNATRMQLPSGTHFHKDEQKYLLSTQSGKVRMDANGPLAKNYRKLNFHAKEVSTWTVEHYLLSGSKPGNLKPRESQPVLPSASLTSQCVSAGRLHLTPLLQHHCHVTSTILLDHMRFYQVLMVLAEGFEINWITLLPVLISQTVFSVECLCWIRQKENSPAVNCTLTLEQY